MIRFFVPIAAIVAPFLSAFFTLASLAQESTESENEALSPILEELRVTASRLPRPPASIDARRLSAEETAFTSQNSLGPALQGQHGITFTNTGGPGKVSTLRIRGEEGSRTTVLIDGIELSDVSTPQVTTNIHHLVVAPGITDVEVLAGPQAFFLGGDAGGVVNIRTAAAQQGYKLDVSAEGGSDQNMLISALGAAGFERGGVSVSAQKWRTAGFSAREDDIELDDRDGYDNVTLHARGHFQPTDNSVVDLVVRHVDATTDFDNCGFPRSDDCVENYEQTSVRVGAVIDTQRFNHRLSASISEVDRENFAADQFSFGAVGDLNKYEYSLSGSVDHWDFAGGVELREEEINERERDQWGYFVEAGVQLNAGFSAGLGLRLDDNDDFGTHLTGRAHASWLTALSQGRSLRVRASYGTGFRAPSLSEEAFNDGAFAFPPASTTELREEQSRGIDVGVALDAASYSAAITYFSQKIEDAIFFDLASFSGFLQADGTSRSSGFTARGHFDITPQLRVSGDYLFNRARLESGERRLRRPRNSGRVNLIYQNDTWSAGASLRYVGEVDDELFLVGRQTLTDYAVVDLTANYQIRDSVQLFGRVTNLFSAEAQDVIGFESAGTGVFAGVKVSLARN